MREPRPPWPTCISQERRAGRSAQRCASAARASTVVPAGALPPRRLHAPVRWLDPRRFRDPEVSQGSLGAAGRYAVKHPIGADILVDFRPVDPLAITDDLEVG